MAGEAFVSRGGGRCLKLFWSLFNAFSAVIMVFLQTIMTVIMPFLQPIMTRLVPFLFFLSSTNWTIVFSAFVSYLKKKLGS